MAGLRTTPASSAPLLLNLEGVLTAGLAWLAFHEHLSGRIALGMALVLAGGAVLSWQGSESLSMPLGSLAIVAACLCWALDNNLAHRVSAADPVQVAALKGGAAGTVNLLLAQALGSPMPRAQAVGGALLLGAAGYGLSLVLFVLALRSLGTTRTGAYFSVAPFAGSAIALGGAQRAREPPLLGSGPPDGRGGGPAPNRTASAPALP
jgi:drug/metabolite transporter (DMT)-like permease